MIMDVTVAITSTWSQTTDNRSVSSLLAQIARQAGGASDGDRLIRAREALRGAIKKFNGFYWKFNRLKQDITLVAGTAEYTLNANFFAPASPGAKMLDAAGIEKEGLGYMDYEDFSQWAADQEETSSSPWLYTMYNGHETGLVQIHPKPSAPLMYPKVRFYYFRQIIFPLSDDLALNVPPDIEEAILDTAIAKFLASVRGFDSAANAFTIANDSLRLALFNQQDWPDLAMR